MTFPDDLASYCRHALDAAELTSDADIPRLVTLVRTGLHPPARRRRS